MNDLLESKLEQIAGDRHLIEAIKEIFLIEIEKEKPVIGEDNDNSLLGEKFRAYEQSKSILNGAITNIESYNNKKTDFKSFNKAK